MFTLYFCIIMCTEFRVTAPLICRKLAGKDSNLLRLAAERLALEPDRNLFRDVQTWRNSRRKIRMEVWWGAEGRLKGTQE